MKILEEVMVVTQKLVIEMDITKDFTSDIHYDYCEDQGYEIIKEDLKGEILTVELTRIRTEKL